MSRWERHGFARLMDWSMRGPEIGRLRARALATAAGHVLEVGFGTGLNLQYYPAAVRSLTALDRLDALIASAGFTLVDCERWVEPGPRVFTAMVCGSARP